MNSSVTFNSLPEVLSYGISLSKASKNIIVGRSFEKLSAESALCAGLLKGGTNVILMGKSIKPELFMASSLYEDALCVYIQDGSFLKIDTEERGGLPLTNKTQELLCESTDTIHAAEGFITDGSVLKNIYLNDLKKILPEKSPFKITVSSSSGFSESFCSEKSSDEIIIQLSPDGTKASIYSDKSGFISYSQLILLCCLEHFEQGHDVALPYDFSFSADKIACEYGEKVHRYVSSGYGVSDKEARSTAVSQRFTSDGMFLALNAVRILTEKKMPLKNMGDIIPESHCLKKYISVDCKKIDGFLNSQRGTSTPDGTSFSEKNGRVLMRPSDSGNGLWLNVESFSMETAEEICGKIEEKLRKFQA